MTDRDYKEQNELLQELSNILAENIYDYELIKYEPIYDEDLDILYGRNIFNKGLKEYNLLTTTDFTIKYIDGNIPRKLLMDTANVLIKVAAGEAEQI